MLLLLSLLLYIVVAIGATVLTVSIVLVDVKCLITINMIITTVAEVDAHCICGINCMSAHPRERDPSSLVLLQISLSFF